MSLTSRSRPTTLRHLAAMREADSPTSRTLRVFAWPSGWLSRGLVWLISGYKYLISPMFTGSCRFVPSCSAYATEAIHRHGAVKGSWLAVWRIARCHPFSRGGLDQVPLCRR